MNLAIDRDRIRALIDDRLALLVVLIALGTVGAGLFQLVFPGVVLDIIDGDTTKTAKHFFAIVGMFMAIVGGITLHSLYTGKAMAMVVGWGSLQKLGASLAVGIGVARDVFGPLALAVAGFDALSFVVMAVLARRSS